MIITSSSSSSLPLFDNHIEFGNLFVPEEIPQKTSFVVACGLTNNVIPWKNWI